LNSEALERGDNTVGGLVERNRPSRIRSIYERLRDANNLAAMGAEMLIRERIIQNADRLTYLNKADCSSRYQELGLEF